MLDEREIEELRHDWSMDANDPDDTWRETLNEEETALVNSWDAAYDAGTVELCRKILKQSEVKPHEAQ